MIKQKRVLLVLLISFLLSLVIEIAQYFTGLGIAEFDDVFNNTVGGFIGALIAEEIALMKSELYKEMLLDR